MCIAPIKYSLDCPALNKVANAPGKISVIATLHAKQSQRDTLVESWLASLEPLNQALALILDLVRNSAQFRKQTSLNGFYQDNGDDADLLRLKLELVSQLYPQISGHKSRFAIRFMPLDSEHGSVPERLDFELACC